MFESKNLLYALKYDNNFRNRKLINFFKEYSLKKIKFFLSFKLKILHKIRKA